MDANFTLEHPAAARDSCAQLFGFTWADADPIGDAAGGALVPVISNDLQGRHRISRMRWGYLPHWIEDERPGTARLTARGDRAFDRPEFENAVQKRRCLIPSDVVFQASAGGTKDSASAIEIRRRDRGVFFLPGIFAEARPTRPETFLFFTTRSRELGGSGDEFMPALLAGAKAVEWLNFTSLTFEQFTPFVDAFPGAEYEVLTSAGAARMSVD